ncbi:MAG: hypothetical protein LBS05_09240 [Tannerellaceae bacterium]|jgi:hypothetical protein|nr:hypothetical protein [Tannerellaceae bacterium]
MEQKIQDMEEKTTTVEVLDIESQTNKELPSDKPVLSPEAMGELAKTARYLRVLYVFYCVGCGFPVLGAILNLASGRNNPISVILSICISVCIYFIGTYMRDTAKAYKRYLETCNIEQLEYAISLQNGFWRLITICLSVSLGLVVLGLVVFVASSFLM